jgi:phage-related protein
MSSSAALELVMRLKDETSGPLNSIKGALGGVGDVAAGVAKAGLLAAAAGATALAGALTFSVKAAMEAQQIDAQLDAVLKSTAGAAGMSKDAIVGLANSLSQLTPFEDDAIVSAQSMLLTFTSIGKDVFPMATETVLNMSQALGQDLKSSAMQLGKALNAPIDGIAALQRVGVKFTAEQKNMIGAMVAMGDVAGAQKIILAELETEFGNSARAAGTTFAGQLTILKNNLGNVAETIGGALLPGLTTLATTLSTKLNSPEIQAAISGMATALGQLFKGDVSGAIASFSGALSNVFGPEKALAIYQFLNGVKDVATTAFTFISTTVVPVLVGAFQSVVGWVTANWPMISSIIQTVCQIIGQVITVIWTQVIPALIQAFQSAVAWVTANWPMIQSIIETVFQVVGQVIGIIINDVIPALVAGFRLAVAWVQENWPKIQQKIEEVINAVWSVIQTVMSAISTFWAENGAAILAKAKEIWTTVQNFIDAAIGFVSGVIQSALSTVKRIWVDNHDAIMNTATRIWDLIKGIIQTAIDIVQGIIKVATDLLKGDWSKAWEDIKTLLQTAWDGMLKIVKDVWELVKAEVTLALGIVKTLFGTKWEEIRLALFTKLKEIVFDIATKWDEIKTTADEKLTLIKNAIIDPIIAAKNKVVEIIDAIKNAFSNLNIHIPMPHFSGGVRWQDFAGISVPVPYVDVSWYKQGMPPTVFDEPTLIGVGEAGPETVSVTPAGGASGGGGKTLHFTYNAYGAGASYAEAEQMARALEFKMRWSPG